MARMRGFLWLFAGIVVALIAGFVAFQTLQRVAEAPLEQGGGGGGCMYSCWDCLPEEVNFAVPETVYRFAIGARQSGQGTSGSCVFGISGRRSASATGVLQSSRHLQVQSAVRRK